MMLVAKPGSRMIPWVDCDDPWAEEGTPRMVLDIGNGSESVLLRSYRLHAGLLHTDTHIIINQKYMYSLRKVMFTLFKSSGVEA